LYSNVVDKEYNSLLPKFIHNDLAVKIQREKKTNKMRLEILGKCDDYNKTFSHM
jgi:hypothetical protein